MIQETCNSSASNNKRCMTKSRVDLIIIFINNSTNFHPFSMLMKFEDNYLIEKAFERVK